MSYEEVVKLVKEIDNLVCGEGVYLYTWQLDDKAVFDEVIDRVYYSSSKYKSHLTNSYEYRESLQKKIRRCTDEGLHTLLNMHKELWLTLIHKSEIAGKYYTPNKSDLFKRLLPLTRQESLIILNKYNFLPPRLLKAYNKDPLIEIGRHEVTSFVIHWKEELIRRYFEVDRLQVYHSKRFVQGDNTLRWSLSDTQINRLVLIFRRYFADRTDREMIVNILTGDRFMVLYGNIIWIKSTEAFVYFFTQLVERGYLTSQDWGMILTRRLMFYSKQGNLITNRNINASLYRMKQKGLLPVSNRLQNTILPKELAQIEKNFENFSKFLKNTK
ncbi:hypothetical protein [Spirosoma sp. KNUC1025]|uniref:hypothetical protein n=1 Tax=Spirosoma sp. KNUC1025 TaxID=2894082 RepID=UPI003863B8B0|nr:hypothetical protein LN737_01250 [Spirosoma sp. KNUC1025]